MMLCRHCEPQFRPTGNTNLPGRDSWSGACQKTSHGTMPRSNTSKSSSGPSSINLMFGKKRKAQVASVEDLRSFILSWVEGWVKNPVHTWNCGSKLAIPATIQVSLVAPAAVAGLSRRTCDAVPSPDEWQFWRIRRMLEAVPCRQASQWYIWNQMDSA
jgi:hypothetical protein